MYVSYAMALMVGWNLGYTTLQAHYHCSNYQSALYILLSSTLCVPWDYLNPVWSARIDGKELHIFPCFLCIALTFLSQLLLELLTLFALCLCLCWRGMTKEVLTESVHLCSLGLCITLTDFFFYQSLFIIMLSPCICILYLANYMCVLGISWD